MRFQCHWVGHNSYSNRYNSNGNNNTNPMHFRSNTKGDYMEMPSNIEVTLKGPVNQDQLAKIKEILKNPHIYKDKIQKNQYPTSGEYAESFTKFHPKQVELMRWQFIMSSATVCT